jgi:hypothetical protein
MNVSMRLGRDKRWAEPGIGQGAGVTFLSLLAQELLVGRVSH